VLFNDIYPLENPVTGNIAMSNRKLHYVHDWSKVNESTIFSYQAVLDDALSRVSLPHPVLTDE